LDDQQLKSAIEALLFIAGNPVSAERLKGVFEDASREQIEAQLNTLRQEHDVRAAGIMLAEIAGGGSSSPGRSMPPGSGSSGP
jgi:chromosome segregation and condensation protein ScpB